MAESGESHWGHAVKLTAGASFGHAVTPCSADAEFPVNAAALETYSESAAGPEGGFVGAAESVAYSADVALSVEFPAHDAVPVAVVCSVHAAHFVDAVGPAAGGCSAYFADPENAAAPVACLGGAATSEGAAGYVGAAVRVACSESVTKSAVACSERVADFEHAVGLAEGRKAPEGDLKC